MANETICCEIEELKAKIEDYKNMEEDFFFLIKVLEYHRTLYVSSDPRVLLNGITEMIECGRNMKAMWF